MTLLETRDLTVSLGGRPIVEGLNLTLRPGEFVGLVGPNGAGKSTLMRALCGLLPVAGNLGLAGTPLHRLTARERATRISYVAQVREIAWGLAVEDVVALGRLPHRAAFAPPTQADRTAVEAALATMALVDLRHRRATDLSGGETARVVVARALAQEAGLLVADEPTAGLDPAHQIGLMSVFRERARKGGAVLASLHELGLAARWCDRVILLDRGRVAADGTPEAVLTPERLARVYGIAVHVARDEGGMLLIPTGLAVPPAGSTP